MSHPVLDSKLLETAPRERRSLFPNFAPGPARSDDEGQVQIATVPLDREESGIGLARSLIHQVLSLSFSYPTSEVWDVLREAELAERILHAARLAGGADLEAAARRWVEAVSYGSFAPMHDAYVETVGHAARGSTPINEIEYGELKADPLFQPHRLADLAAFYRAFGVELLGGAGERPDHLSIELEFMAVLAAQEAHLVAEKVGDDILRVNLDAQRRFLREHLARWSPTFARRLQAVTAEPVLSASARFLLAHLQAESMRRVGQWIDDELTLRPADEGAALCDQCGIDQRLPGAPQMTSAT